MSTGRPLSTPLRVAFLTREFPTERDGGGGLGAYLARMATALRDAGHEPEVFTLSARPPAVLAWHGVRVERVRPTRWLLPATVLGRLSALVPGVSIAWTCTYVRGAAGLAAAFRKRHRSRPFDIVQSSDFGLTGLFVGAGAGARHVVRCSWAADLFLQADGHAGPDRHLMAALERRVIRRADRAYAPSRWLAEHYRERHGIPLAVLRPPFPELPDPAGAPVVSLPPRYLLFFGLIGPRKGCDVLASALRLALRAAPDLRMVWAGAEARPGEFRACRERWGGGDDVVMWLGPVPRAQLAALLRGALCSVLPSRHDNLPNTALESLAAGVPVIGTSESSLEEVVRPGLNGVLVPQGDPVALAAAMVDVWRGTVRFAPGAVHSPVLAEMTPAAAVQRLIEFCREGRRHSAPEQVGLDA